MPELSTKVTRPTIVHDLPYIAELVQNLQVGTIYTYKDLCTILRSEAFTGGASKIAQKKVWDKYFRTEKIGYRYKVTEIFPSKLLPDFQSLFAADEGHLMTSAIKLLKFFKTSKDKVASEKFPEINELLLYSKDFATICGYISEDYYFDRQCYRAGDYKNSLSSYFHTTVGNKFSELLRNLLLSLQRKGIITHSRKVLTKFDKEKGKRVVLSDEEEAKYNLLIQEYWKSKGIMDKNTTFGFSEKDWVAFGKLTTELGANIYSGYYVAFTEQNVLEGLQAIEDNKIHFSKTVIRVFNRDRDIALKSMKEREAKLAGLLVGEELPKESFLEKVFKEEDALFLLEKLVRELL